MAKFASIITFLLVVLIIFSAFEAPTIVEGQKSCKRQPNSGSKNCMKDSECQKICIKTEKALRATCDYTFPRRIEGWLAEQVERGSDAPVDTLEKSKSVPKIKRLQAINKTTGSISLLIPLVSSPRHKPPREHGTTRISATASVVVFLNLRPILISAVMAIIQTKFENHVHITLL
ncbi:hypothetical protein F2Q69_00010729 [Brassica cretica]|uniref:Uncharacterized protein n=1 Tax=Brassica cretica TaxID=69181 RepID=A0A8S9R352_BRACR|nr:hypothetical protein F2Q69_00010729 [Brassica cretica]